MRRCGGTLRLQLLGSEFACFQIQILRNSRKEIFFSSFLHPTNEQLHILEGVQSDGQLLKPSVQNELQPGRTSGLASPFSDTVFWGYITALTAWLRSTFLARYARRRPCCMRQWLRLPTGLLFLWRRTQGCMSRRSDWRGNRWSVKVIRSVETFRLSLKLFVRRACRCREAAGRRHSHSALLPFGRPFCPPQRWMLDHSGGRPTGRVSALNSAPLRSAEL